MPLKFYQIELPESFYLKDPTKTELGIKMVSTGASLLCEVGFTHFTFKELATSINSVEASVYRYFSSKEQFLTFCVGTYWSLLNARLRMYTINIGDPYTKFDRMLDILFNDIKDKQFQIIAYKKYGDFRLIATRYTHFTLGILSDNKEFAQLLSDFTNNAKDVYIFVQNILKELDINTEHITLMATNVIANTLMAPTTASFYEDLIPGELETKKMVAFIKEYVGI